MSEDGYLVHVCPGRFRVKLPARRGDPDFFVRASSGLQAHPMVRSCSANPRTASILVLHEGTAGRLLNYAAQRGLFQVQHLQGGPSRIAADVRGNVARVDEVIRQVSAGNLNLRSAGAALLLVMATVQVGRGEIWGPAASLVWDALQLLNPDLPPGLRSRSGGDGD